MDSNDGSEREWPPPLTSYLFTLIMAVSLILFFYLSFMRYRQRKHTARVKEAEYINYVLLGRPDCTRSNLGITRARSLMTGTHYSTSDTVWTSNESFFDKPPIPTSRTPAMAAVVDAAINKINKQPGLTYDLEQPCGAVYAPENQTDLHKKAPSVDTDAEIHHTTLPEPSKRINVCLEQPEHAIEIDSTPQQKRKRSRKWTQLKKKTKKKKDKSKASKRFEMGPYKSLSLDSSDIYHSNEDDVLSDTSVRHTSEPYLSVGDHEHSFHGSTRFNTNSYYSDNFLPLPMARSNRLRALPQLDNVYHQNMYSRRYSDSTAHVRSKRKLKEAKSYGDQVGIDLKEFSRPAPLNRSLTMPDTSLVEMGDKTYYSSKM